MFTNLLHWDIIEKIILNTILVSIPEEFYLIMFTLILMGEFDYWKEEECKKLFDRWDYIRVFVPVVIGALTSNVLRYSGMDVNLVTVISMMVFFIAIILTGDIWGDASALKWIGKAFIFLLLGILSIMVIEFMFIPLFLYGLKESLHEINQNIMLNFVMTLPLKIVQFTILGFLFAKKRTIIKVDLGEYIFKNRFFSMIFFFVMLFNFIFMLIMYKVVIYEGVLSEFTISLQIALNACIFSFPILNISFLIWEIYYIKNQETYKQKIVAKHLKELINEMNIYTNNERYDNIKWKIHEMEKVTDLLYKEGE